MELSTTSIRHWVHLLPVHVDLAQFPRLVCRRCGLVALVDPQLPMDEHASLACPRCRGKLGWPRISPADLPDEPPAESRARREPPVPQQARVPSNALVGLSIAGLFLLLLFGFFLFMLLTPHTPHVNPYYPRP
ncbi:MAG TPA: hypothetical protein VIN56_02700 [Candidatus Dormibacteraeota bacterium]|jgi:hypothetical protein